MTTNKLAAFIFTLAFATQAYAHPDHAHSHNFMERLLHAIQTEWLAPLLVVILIGIAGYAYFRHSDNDRQGKPW